MGRGEHRVLLREAAALRAYEASMARRDEALGWTRMKTMRLEASGMGWERYALEIAALGT